MKTALDCTAPVGAAVPCVGKHQGEIVLPAGGCHRLDKQACLKNILFPFCGAVCALVAKGGDNQFVDSVSLRGRGPAPGPLIDATGSLTPRYPA